MQCALAQAEDGRGRRRLVRRAAQLLHLHHDTWVQALATSHDNKRARFHRGFLSSWDARGGELPQALLEAAPIDALSLTVNAAHEPDEAWAVVESAPVERMRSLEISLVIDDYDENPARDSAPDRLLQLLHDNRFASLRSLSLRGFAFSGLASLASAPTVQRLHELRLDVYGCDDQAAESLPMLTGLKSLTMNNTQMTAAGLQQVAACQQLESLFIRTSDSIPMQTYEHLLGSMPRLVGLALSAPLAAALPKIGRLVSLTVAPFTPVAGAVAKLEKALPQLQTLDLSYCTLEASDFQALAKIESLRSLSLCSSHVGDAAAGWLAQAGPLEGLELLDLRGNRVSKDSLARLHERFGHAVVTDQWLIG